MCEMCELALARGEEAPEYHTLPVHPDYLGKSAPKFVAAGIPAPEDDSTTPTDGEKAGTLGLPSSAP